MTSGFNFDELGDRLGVDDETRDIDRPAPPPRPIGQILQPASAPQARDAAPPPPPKTATRRRTSTSTSADRTSVRREHGERSSANLPIALVEQLVRYKQHQRWELSQLVASALAHIDTAHVADQDKILNDQWHGPRTARHYQLQGTDLERLDALGQQWRMNRSQTITVLVTLEARRLGLAADA